MTHKQWFNNVLHLHPVHEEGAFSSRKSIEDHGVTVKSLIRNVLSYHVMGVLLRCFATQATSDANGEFLFF